MHNPNEVKAKLPTPHLISDFQRNAHTTVPKPALPVPNKGLSDTKHVPLTPIKNTKTRSGRASNELTPQTTLSLTKEKTSEIKAKRPTRFDYQAQIKKIVLSTIGDTTHHDGSNISTALIQMPFIEFDTAVIKVSNFISLAKEEAVEVNNLEELRGKTIQVMNGESEIMVIQIFGKEDSLIWWGSDVNHQIGLQILSSNRNPFCQSNEEFSFDVVGSIKAGYKQVNVAANSEAITSSDSKFDDDLFDRKINSQETNQLKILRKKRLDFDLLKNASSKTNSGAFFTQHEEENVVQEIKNNLDKFQGSLPKPGLFSNQVKSKRRLINGISDEPNAKRVKHNSGEYQGTASDIDEKIEIFTKK